MTFFHKPEVWFDEKEMEKEVRKYIEHNEPHNIGNNYWVYCFEALGYSVTIEAERLLYGFDADLESILVEAL